MIDRRHFIGSAAGSSFLGLATWGTAGMTQTPPAAEPTPRLGPPEPFDFERLAVTAARAAENTYRTPEIAEREIIDRIDYGNHSQIWFLEKYGAWREPNQPGPVHFVHPGRFFKEPIRVLLVDGGQAREILPASDAFGYPADHPGRALTDPPPYAGLRFLNPGTFTDWLSFLGKSYFRASGPFDQYGLSARGVLVNAGLPVPEEFPRFSRFWLQEEGDGFTIFAFLEGPSLTGAFAFACRRPRDVIMDVEARLFVRRDIDRLGIAPLTSMYWYGENDRRNAVDWRAEIHDSDGLLIDNGQGERLWRPLNNPPRVMTNSFVDDDPKGFGLMQRDRSFASYEDSVFRYHERPSVWIEPLEPWGPGAVQLLEIPTDDEIHDNVGAYWVSARPARRGDRLRYRYRLTWTASRPEDRTGRAGVVATREGTGGIPEQPRPPATRRFVVDFKAAGDGVSDDGVVPSADVSTSRGQIVRAFVRPVPATNSYRLIFDLEARGRDALDLRADLRLNDRVISETWIYQTFPNTWPNAEPPLD
ncbi:MAG: glucan biosynthesis protein [Pseudomonadota bacterium]